MLEKPPLKGQVLFVEGNTIIVVEAGILITYT